MPDAANLEGSSNSPSVPLAPASKLATSTLRVTRTQGILFITGKFSPKAGEEIIENGLIATLPEGFRPMFEYTFIPITSEIVSPSEATPIVTAIVKPNGEILCGPTKTNGIRGTINYGLFFSVPIR